MVTTLQRLFRFWFTVLLVVGAAYVAVFNRAPIYVYLPGIGQFNLPAAYVYGICFLTGAVTVAVFMMSGIVKRSLEIKRCRKRIRALEAQIGEHGSIQTAPQRRSWFFGREPSVHDEPSKAEK